MWWNYTDVKRINDSYTAVVWAGIAQSAVQESNPGGGRDFPHPSRPVLGPTRLLYNGCRVSSPGGKAAGAWRPPTSSSSEVKEKVDIITVLPLWASVACFRVNFTFTFYTAVVGSLLGRRIPSVAGERRVYESVCVTSRSANSRQIYLSSIVIDLGKI